MRPSAVIDPFVQQFEVDGVAAVPGAVADAELATIEVALARLGGFRGASAAVAARNGLDIPAIAAFAREGTMIDVARRLGGPDAFPVRAVLFAKTATSNWKVPWHQDLTVAVARRADAPGYGPWSIKGGVEHVQAPPHILEGMVSIRVAIDECDEAGGPLRIVPRSHLAGRLTRDQIDAVVRDAEPVACCQSRGGVLALRPLIVHGSSVMRRVTGSRRVLHIDYAVDQLEYGLTWRWS